MIHWYCYCCKVSRELARERCSLRAALRWEEDCVTDTVRTFKHSFGAVDLVNSITVGNVDIVRITVDNVGTVRITVHAAPFPCCVKEKYTSLSHI